MVAGFGQGDDLVTHDQVIEHAHIDDRQDLGERPGQLDVLTARYNAARGVVVRQDDRCGVQAQRLLDDLARVDRGPVDRAVEQFPPGEHLVAAVEKQAGERFVFQPGQLEADGLPGGKG